MKNCRHPLLFSPLFLSRSNATTTPLHPISNPDRAVALGRGDELLQSPRGPCRRRAPVAVPAPRVPDGSLRRARDGRAHPAAAAAARDAAAATGVRGARGRRAPPPPPPIPSPARDASVAAHVPAALRAAAAADVPAAVRDAAADVPAAVRAAAAADVPAAVRAAAAASASPQEPRPFVRGRMLRRFCSNLLLLPHGRMLLT